MKIFIISLLMLLNACATVKVISIPQVNVKPIQSSGIASAGAIAVDITPPPGLPMGGYSIMANKGKGFRTRLKARIIYLNDGSGNATALVQTDLTASSLLLHHMVANKVAKETGLRAGDIAITASHSHSAPANIFENDFYNKHMSSSPGLAENYLNFIVKQISEGIVQAYQQRHAAKIATGTKNIYGYNRNRSIDAYRKNHNISEASVFESVNPALNMIRVDVKNDSETYVPIAAFSSFSVHATAITPQVDVYNADLFAYAQKDLEWYIEQKYQTPWPIVHALTTGTQGDMAPALKPQGDNYIRHFPLNWKSAKIIGKGIGKEAIDLFESLGDSLTNNIDIVTSTNEMNIRKNNVVSNIQLCKDAAIGSSVIGGAFERRTPWLSLIPFFKAGNLFSHRSLFTDGCQGNKSHAGFSFLQPLFEPKNSFPSIVMFQLIKINDTIIAPIPFEVTIEAGRRISTAIKNNFKENIRYVWITSNSNGYFGYTTTLEEYNQQNYEGGHTLYGKNTTKYISKQLSKLANNKLGKHQKLPTWRYKVAVNQFSPLPTKSVGTRKIIQAPTAFSAKSEYDEDYISIKWLDVGPGNINFHQPLVSIEIEKNEHWIPLSIDNQMITDEGYEIEIRYLESAEQGMGRYEARWYNPLSIGEFRFVIAARETQKVIYSNSW